MKKYLNVLKKCILFNNIDEEEIMSMQGCMGGKISMFKKGQIIIEEGEPVTCLGVVLSGAVQVIRVDFNGNRSIMALIKTSDIFGEAFACAQTQSAPVSVVANEDCEIMLINVMKIMQTCEKCCGFHTQLIFNLIKLLASKNLMINEKIQITSKRTTREKLLTYLSIRAKAEGSSAFAIPFDRQGLADYLEVDRSGLSAEISKLRAEGIITCRKNHFTLLEG